MDTRNAYNNWSSQYDSNENKTRDMEAVALRKSLENIFFTTCLEMGCGTGKNTEWLAKKARHVTAVDFSDEMLVKAKQKITSSNVVFRQADINGVWHFAEGKYDLVTFSLVLEHIENLDHIFENVSAMLNADGHVYIGELHPFKQYSGSKARFETETGLHIVECYTHHISDFIQSAKKQGLEIADINEYFDDDDRTSVPRILVIMLKKL
ncbi:MAG TPA: class I SAM-dependent methyltransferase [Puia sp.]|nr:class I SAM-dependent methyltransferase [Puia sp.]